VFGGQASGCAPVATAFADERLVSPIRPATIVQSLAIGNPADGDLAVATARASGGAIYAVPEENVGDNVALLAETTGVWGESAAGVTLGALRAAVEARELGADDRVVLLVTGSGLKTPQIVESTRAVIEIDPDVDVLLSELGVGA
jgi:threonine synthase